MSSGGNIVKLDVGGTIFKTSKSTLTNYDGMLRTMMETKVPVKTSANETIFIDRSPKHFEKILNYMRDGDVDLPESEDEVQEIQREARFYLLDGLVDLCNFNIRHVVEETGVIANKMMKCKKKAVVVIHYDEDEIASASDIVQIIEKYSDEFDVYLCRHEGVAFGREYSIHDKKTNKVHYGSRHEFRDYIKEKYGVERDLLIEANNLNEYFS